MRERLYQWHLRLARAFSVLTNEEQNRLAAWREEFPMLPDCDWPEWPQIIGEPPASKPVLAFQRERSA